MSTGAKCKECGTVIPPSTPGGLCGQCLFALGLADAENPNQATPESLRPGVQGETECPGAEGTGALAKTGLEKLAPVTASLTERPGDRIGRYRLLEEIGQGGCGVVYMAEQEKPVRRRVALKVIKLGMDTKQVVARFEAERQALALMDHPNIAKVLDAGTTDTGRPYFVMELVGGIRITEFCDQNALTTRQRLDLFIQVCKALQHAHQKGVIHRDIKPSNILVALQDGVAVPKVIDFGIAKATQGRLTDQTLFTAFEQFLGTPAYMSPEQAQLGGLDVDTRSDIYSLGVLLYELLTGKTPFDAKELLAAGLEAMRRTIQEKEPPTPSTRLIQELVAADVSRRKLSAQENKAISTDSRRRLQGLVGQLRGDLDWIVMKCLEKDRARRYETVNGLARDIERHLNNEPVVAGPPSRIYRLQKLVRRNKVAFGAATAVTLVLLLGVIVSTWQAVRARRAESEQSRLLLAARAAQANEARERRRAQTEASKSQQVAQFLKDMLNSVSPSIALGQDTSLLRGILDKTAQRVGNELTNQPQVELELRVILSGIYLDLSLYKEAQDTLQAGLKVARAAFGEESLEVAYALANLGYAQWGLGEFDRAEASEREALRIRRKNSAMDDLEASRALNNLGLALAPQGKVTEAEEAYRQALGLQQKISGKDTPELAMVLGNLGAVLGQAGKWEEAAVEQRKALEMRRTLLGPVHPDIAIGMNNLATCLVVLGKLSEAEEMLREVMSMQRKLFGSKHHQLAVALYNLASCLRREGKLDEAEDRLRESLAMVRDLFGNEHVDVAATLHELAILLKKRGRLAEAEDSLRQALAVNRKLLGDNHPETTLSFNNLRAILWDLGKLHEAERLCQEHVTALQAHPPVDAQQLADALAALATTLLMEKKFSQAEPLARECLTIREAKSPEDWLTFNTRNLLGASLLGQKKYAEAEPLLVSGYEGMKQREASIPGQARSRLKDALDRLVHLYTATDRPDQAAECRKRLEEFERSQTEKPSAAPPPSKPPP
jgi:eukaryotic-like serine/threonine-protein kinase